MPSGPEGETTPGPKRAGLERSRSACLWGCPPGDTVPQLVSWKCGNEKFSWSHLRFCLVVWVVLQLLPDALKPLSSRRQASTTGEQA